MDPDATLAAILAAIHDGDTDAAVDLLRHLADWLEAGGFVPPTSRMVSWGEAMTFARAVAANPESNIE